LSSLTLLLDLGEITEEVGKFTVGGNSQGTGPFRTDTFTTVFGMLGKDADLVVRGTKLTRNRHLKTSLSNYQRKDKMVGAAGFWHGERFSGRKQDKEGILLRH